MHMGLVHIGIPTLLVLGLNLDILSLNKKRGQLLTRKPFILLSPTSRPGCRLPIDPAIAC